MHPIYFCFISVFLGQKEKGFKFPLTIIMFYTTFNKITQIWLT